MAVYVNESPALWGSSFPDHSAAPAGPILGPMDSRLRGNDEYGAIFRGASVRRSKRPKARTGKWGPQEQGRKGFAEKMLKIVGTNSRIC